MLRILANPATGIFTRDSLAGVWRRGIRRYRLEVAVGRFSLETVFGEVVVDSPVAVPVIGFKRLELGITGDNTSGVLVLGVAVWRDKLFPFGGWDKTIRALLFSGCRRGSCFQFFEQIAGGRELGS